MTIRKLRVVAKATFLLKCLSYRTKLLRVGENLRANTASQIVCFVNNTYQNLVKCWTVFHGFAYNSLISRPFSTRRVSNRSSHHALHNGQGVVSSIQLLVWSTVRSNLGQTRSTLVELGQIWSKLSELWEMYPGPCFEGFFGMVDPSRVRNGSIKPRSALGQPWSNLVNLGKTWSDFGKCALDPVLRLFVMAGLRRIRPAWFGLPRFEYRHPRKSRG